MNMNENRVTGITPETGTLTEKTTRSSDRLELLKEHNPWDRAFLGLMQKKSHFSVKIVALEQLPTKTGSVQVVVKLN